MAGESMVELSADTIVWLVVVLFKKVMEDPFATDKMEGENELSSILI